MAGTARRVMRLVESRGQPDDLDDGAARDDPLLATLMAASIQSRIATGPAAGQRWRRLGDRLEPADEDVAEDPPRRCVREGGMSLHADVAVPARDRKRLERLCRYVARPPIAIDRVEALPEGCLAYRWKTRWRDGTTHVLMERHELLERLAPLIPPPRAHQVRYHGLLAPCASGRDRVVPRPAVSSEAGTAGPLVVADGSTRLLGQANRREGESEPAPNISESLERSLETASSATPGLRADRATTNAAATGAQHGRGGTPPSQSTHQAPPVGRTPAAGLRGGCSALPALRRAHARACRHHAGRRRPSDPHLPERAFAGSPAREEPPRRPNRRQAGRRSSERRAG